MLTPPQLVIGAETFEGFLTVSVTQSVDAFASSFRMTFDDGATLAGEEANIACGDPCQVWLEGNRLFDGYIEDARSLYDGKKRERSVSGRSRLGDLLDVSAYVPGRKVWRNASIEDIAEELLDGYDVALDVRSDRGREPFRRFALNEGETIASLLLRAAKLRGALLLDDGGDLAVAEPGERETSTAIRYGDGGNALVGSRQTSWRERFSEYVFRGQTRATDEEYGVDAAELQGLVEDPEVTRLRRMVVASWGDKGADLGVRAIRERNRRAGRSELLAYQLPGWLDDNGDIWRPNTRVNVRDPKLAVDGVMLTTKTTLNYQPGVARTSLELTLPQAFDSSRTVPVVGRRGELG